MAKKEDGAPEAPGVYGVSGLAPVGASSAVGTPAAQAKRDDSTIPQGEDRGSKVPTDEVVADGAGNDSQQPQGLQAEPALLGDRGEIALNMVPSPSGPVPASAVARDPDHAKAIVEARREQVEGEMRKSAHDELSEEEIDALDGPTARAIMETRGYELPRGSGSRTAREALKKAQGEDKRYSAPTGRRAKKTTPSEE